MRVGDVAVVQGVVDAGDGHGLRRVPVRGRERDARRRDRAFGRRRSSSARCVTSAVGLLVSTTVNVAVPPASVVVRPDVGRDGDARGVVVGVGDRDVIRVDPVVDRVAAGRRRSHDGVGDVAVVEGVVDAGHGDGLRHVPVAGS